MADSEEAHREAQTPPLQMTNQRARGEPPCAGARTREPPPERWHRARARRVRPTPRARGAGGRRGWRCRREPRSDGGAD